MKNKNHPNILSLWITGEAAKHMESLDIEEVKKDSMNLLRAFLYNVPGFQDLKDPLPMFGRAFQELFKIM